jgi:hypothetical protein
MVCACEVMLEPTGTRLVRSPAVDARELGGVVHDGRHVFREPDVGILGGTGIRARVLRGGCG